MSINSILAALAQDAAVMGKAQTSTELEEVAEGTEKDTKSSFMSPNKRSSASKYSLKALDKERKKQYNTNVAGPYQKLQKKWGNQLSWVQHITQPINEE